MYFSPVSSCFYSEKINNNIPQDAFKISLAVYKDLLDKQAVGFTITTDVDGNPIAVAYEE